MPNYRICRLSIHFYDQAFDKLRKSGQLEHASYQELMDLHLGEASVYGDDFSREMRALGNEALELLPVTEVIQKRWAAENGISYDENLWPLQILEAQLERLRPDVVYIQGVNAVPWLVLRSLRDQMPFIKLVVGYVGCPLDPAIASRLDLVISCVPSIQDNLRRCGVASHVVYHAFSERTLVAVDDRAARCGSAAPVDFSFIGSTGAGWGEGHFTRYMSLLYLMYASDLTAFVTEGGTNNLSRNPNEFQLTAESEAVIRQAVASTYGAEAPDRRFRLLLDFLQQSVGLDLPCIPVKYLFPERCRPPVFGLDMYDLLRRSRVTLNVHTDMAYGSVGNMRLFEATGMGTCLLTDNGSNLAELFEPDSEVVTFSSLAECAEKAQWLADHPAEREAIARAGQRRTLADHSVAARCRQIHELICAAMQ